jgi:hypothetical protein
MNLIIGLAAVDEATGGKQMRRLADGWVGRESKTLRRVRALGARALVSMAVRLDATARPAGQEAPALPAPTRA